MTPDPRRLPVHEAADAREREVVADVRSVEPLALRAADAARVLGISVRALWTLTRRGEIPFVRLGRSVTFPIDELRAWLKRKVNAANAASRVRGRGSTAADSAPE